MNISLLLETFEDAFQSLDSLGISKHRTSKALFYSFSDGVASYEVAIETGELIKFFKDILTDREKAIDDWQSYLYGYIDLTANESVAPTGRMNQRFVYNRLLASIVDSIVNENVRIVSFTPYNDKMGLVYISMAKKLMSSIKGIELTPINEFMYIDKYFFDMLPLSIKTKISDKYGADVDKRREFLKRDVKRKNIRKRMKEHFTKLWDRMCEYNGYVGLLTNYDILFDSNSVSVTLTKDIGASYETKDFAIPLDEIQNIKLVEQ